MLDHPALKELVLPILRADFTLAETTRPDLSAPVSCPLSAFGGLADPMVPREDLAAWECRTTAAFKLRMLSGDHFFLRDRQGDLAAAISSDLAPVLGLH
ncbi:Linear gramicidin dehydrogenase LgrE [compost metagenome]